MTDTQRLDWLEANVEVVELKAWGTAWVAGCDEGTLRELIDREAGAALIADGSLDIRDKTPHPGLAEWEEPHSPTIEELEDFFQNGQVIDGLG